MSNTTHSSELSGVSPDKNCTTVVHELLAYGINQRIDNIDEKVHWLNLINTLITQLEGCVQTSSAYLEVLKKERFKLLEFHSFSPFSYTDTFSYMSQLLNTLIDLLQKDLGLTK